MRVETIQIKKKDRVEEWKVFQFEDGKTFRFTNKMFLEYRIWKDKYLGHFQYWCLFIPQKNLFIDKDKKHRVIIIPANNFTVVNSHYTLLTKDNHHAMILIDHNNDVLIEYKVENRKRYIWFGGQEKNEDQVIQIVEVENDAVLDLETIKRVYEKKNNSISFKFLDYFTTSIIDEEVKIHKSTNHKIILAENAQHVKALDSYTTWKNVLISGNKKYVEVGMYKGDGVVYTYHSDDIPLIPNDNDIIEKAIKDEEILYAFAEIPDDINLQNVEITIKKWEYDAHSHYAENTYYCEAYQCEVSDYTSYSDKKLLKEEKVKLTDLLNIQ
jgi:hypothetical protein